MNGFSFVSHNKESTTIWSCLEGSEGDNSITDQWSYYLHPLKWPNVNAY